jgi:hypothetical protein
MITDPQPAVAMERRLGDRRVDSGELSPAFVAVLLLCGGEARDTDRASGADAEPRDRREGPPRRLATTAST